MFNQSKSTSLSILILVLSVVCSRVPAGAEITTNAPLPKIQDILPQVVRKAEAEDNNGRLFKERYHFDRTRVTVFLNSDGDVLKRIERKKTNACPLSASAQQPPAAPKPKVKGDPLLANNGKATDTESSLNNRPYEKSDFPITDEMLARFEFNMIGTETLNGRSVWVVDFKPIKGKKPESHIVDKFINRAAGRLWIDAEDYAIARAELFLTERVLVVGGLVGSVSKFNCDMQRERTPDGLWYMRSTHWHVEGREFVVRRMVNYSEEFNDVRPFSS